MRVTSPEVAQARSGESQHGAGQGWPGRAGAPGEGPAATPGAGAEVSVAASSPCSSVLGKARDRNKTLLVCPGSRVWHPGEGMNTCA